MNPFCGHFLPTRNRLAQTNAPATVNNIAQRICSFAGTLFRFSALIASEPANIQRKMLSRSRKIVSVFQGFPDNTCATYYTEDEGDHAKIADRLCSSARGTVSFLSMFKAVAAVSVSLATGLLLAACHAETKVDREKVVTTKSAAFHAHTNRLSREKSPYLLQHQHNPVDWYAWGEEAFKKARNEKKPIFLSIGYSTCHWCHVMERESLESEDIARFLNEHFICIKVDREERPDVDKIYMTFVQATAGQGGWPLNTFLTPDLKPFFGGTYFPPDNRYGRPSFLQLLQQIAQLWSERQMEVAASADELHARLELITARDAKEDLALTPDVLRQALAMFKEAYDNVNG